MTRKRRLAIAVIAFALIVIGGEAVVESIAVEGFHALVEDRLSQATGLEVRFGSDFHLEIVPLLRFEADSVTVTDPHGPSSPLLTVQSLLLEVDPWQLLSGVIQIDELKFHHAELMVDSDTRGESPLPSDTTPPPEPMPAEPESKSDFLQIRRVDAKDLRIVFRSGTAKPSVSLVIDELALQAEESDEPASVAMRGSFEGNRFEIEGEVGALPQLLSPTTPYPVSLRTRVGDIETSLVGSIEEPLALRGIAMDVRLDARDLALIGDLLELEVSLPPIGPVSMTTTLRGDPDAIGAEDLVVRVGQRDATWLEFDGSIGDLEKFKQVHLVAKFAVADLRHVQSLVEHDLPHVGPIRGGLTLSDRDGTLGIELLRVAGGREGTLEIDFSGGIGHLIESDEIDFDAKIEVKHLSIIGDLFGVDLPPIGPISFSGHMTGHDEELSAHGRARLDETVFIGDLSGSVAPGTRPRLRARIQSKHVHLADVGIEFLPNPSEQNRVEGVDSESWWSGNAPLPFLEWLQVLDADIVLEADRVSGRSGLEVKPLRLVIQLDDGNLVIPDVAAGYQTGTVKLEAQIDARTSVPSFALKGRADNVNLTTLIAQLDEDTESAGLLDVLVDLESRGSALSEIRSNLAGSLRLLLKNGTLAGKYGSAFVNNVVKLSLPALIPHRTPQFGCIVAEFQLADGVATVGNLVLDSAKTHVAGSGTIDIGANAFDLELHPKAKKPGVINLAAVVDVSGPLADPVFKPRLHTVPGNVARGLISNVLAPGAALIQPFRSKGEMDSLCAKGFPVEPPD